MVGLRQSIAPVAHSAPPWRGGGEARHYGGHQAQRDKRRDRDGHCEYQTELLKKPAGGARQEHLTLGLGFIFKQYKLDVAADFAETDNEYLLSFIQGLFWPAWMVYEVFRALGA